ncbi:hypothetical protein [Frigoriglobus tundricola]|uniref:Uncharacterized protein n=1 Tax=Frigoriglobus tundricola TaxID=2774151 RepID=A0A6M5YZH8_9BACT|nr:hypothetical protein [Frigoriglobus tundricola]QJW98631.1 hypothetical protein FTUN_6226 [Frigoriglobus tundricola]
MAAPGLLGRVRARLAGGAVGRVRLVAASGASDWCVVCWGRGRLAGVEFFRLSPAQVPDVAHNPDAAPTAPDPAA